MGSSVRRPEGGRAVHPSAAAALGVSARPPRRGGRVLRRDQASSPNIGPGSGEKAAVRELGMMVSAVNFCRLPGGPQGRRGGGYCR
ncbi:hypothetical protein [Leadbettera azotonutricia]|uniref:hypothetical protein n=1 Tax=Leadbettera azotonutricia TaxID=150829 RepID=UPI0011D22282|nr:hypothetical protein [Leadbettera azotonutricia]